MDRQQDKLLANAGGLLIGAGALGAFVGGSYGLVQQNPGLIIGSVVLLMGYGVVGYLLMNRGARYFHVALPASAVLVVATLLLFQGEMRRALDDALFQYLLKPGLTLLLAYAAGALLTHVVESTTERVTWPGRGSAQLNTLLHLAAFAPIWCAYTLLDMMRTPSAWAGILIVGGSAAVAIACVVGGYAAARGSHPKFTLGGAALGFVVSASYLYQFMATRASGGEAVFGQLSALAGLILAGIPLAIAAVAWIQVQNGDVDPEAEPAP